MYGKSVPSIVVCVFVIVISSSIYFGSVDLKSYFFPLLPSPPGAPSPCAPNRPLPPPPPPPPTLPPLRVYMYDLPRRFNVGMLNRRDPDQTPVTAANFPRWPEHSGLMRQHSVEYWMMASLVYDGGEDREAVRVSDPEIADAFFVPFFSSISVNTHGRNLTDPDTEIDHQLQIDLLEFLRQSKYWQRSAGRDHVIPMTHPNAFRFLREQVNASILIVADFGRYPQTMANLSKDVVAPYVHVVESLTYDDIPDPFESRPILLFFRGRTVRKAEGVIRAKLEKILADYDDVRFEGSLAVTAEGIKASSQGMRSSKFCLHPAGDTPSSCRLFDAIVSHCVPVIVSDHIELPYEDEINYTEFSLFFSSNEALEPGYMVTQLRKIQNDRWIEMWSRLRNISHHFEFQNPPKKEDATNMLWRQVRHKLPATKLAVHRSQRLKVPDWWR